MDLREIPMETRGELLLWRFSGCFGRGVAGDRVFHAFGYAFGGVGGSDANGSGAVADTFAEVGGSGYEVAVLDVGAELPAAVPDISAALRVGVDGFLACFFELSP